METGIGQHYEYVNEVTHSRGRANELSRTCGRSVKDRNRGVILDHSEEMGKDLL